MKNCAFCEDVSIKNREIYRDGVVFSFPTNIPIVPGHVLVCPVRHAETFSELSRAEVDSILAHAEELKSALREEYGADGFHEIWNEGAVAGQTVPHFHLHIVPRKAGDTGIVDYDPRKFLYRPGSREQSPAAELQAVARGLTMRLSV